MNQPPAPPPLDWQPPRPTSGKAVASLACGIGGLLLTVLCVVGFVASVVGVVLGAIAIAETGREGTRSGRGLAIAGTIVSALSIVAAIGVTVALYGVFVSAERQAIQQRETAIDQDRPLVLERLRLYYEQNDGSLGPGGPVLAVPPPQSENLRERGPGEHYHADLIADTRDGRVAGELRMEHLLRQGELGHPLSLWELTVTDRARATLRVKDWSGELVREIHVTDAARGDFYETRFTKR
jgi:hypothetical protein